MSKGTDSLVKRLITLATRQGKQIAWYGSEDALIARRIKALTEELQGKIKRAEAGQYYVRGRGYPAGSPSAKKAAKKRAATLAARKSAAITRTRRK